MKFSHIHSAILRDRWLIEKSWQDSHVMLVAKLMAGENIDFVGNKSTEYDLPHLIQQSAQASVYSVSPGNYIDKLPQGSIAMIDISGPMTKRGGMCSYGMEDYAALISQAANTNSISGILISIDSPGGQATGTASLANTIRQASQKKPVIAFVNDGMAASAGMWIASGAPEIYATQKTDIFGSIGVYTTIANWYNHYKEYYKLDVMDIYAPQSTEKNKIYRDALNGDTEGIENELSFLADQIINTIQSNRGGKLTGNDWKTGKTFNAVEAKKIGLIDGIKSFDQIVERMNQLIKKQSTTSKNNNMAFEKTLAAAGVTEFSVVDGGFLLTEDMLNSLEASISRQMSELETLQQSLTDAQGQVSTLTESLNDANQTVVARDNRIAELQTELEQWGGKASGKGSTITTDPKSETPSSGNEEEPYHLSSKNPANAWADQKLARRRNA